MNLLTDNSSDGEAVPGASGGSPGTALTAGDLQEVLMLAAAFGGDVPRRLALSLDTGDANALSETWTGLCETGLDRCVAPEEEGGIALPLEHLPAVAERVAGGDAGTAMLILLSNIAHALLPEGSAVDADTRCVYVPAVGAGGVHEIAPRLDRSGQLTGHCGLALGAAGATSFVVACRDQESEGLAAALVDATASGVCAEPVDDALGLRGAPAVRLGFDGVRVDRCGDGHDVVAADALLHAGIAAIARGVARRAADMADRYARDRYQGGKQIIGHGAVRDMLGRMRERELGIPAAIDWRGSGLAAKIALSDAAVLTTIDAVQVFGGVGYMHETGVEKLMRDAKYCQLWPRPNWVLRDELVVAG